MAGGGAVRVKQHQRSMKSSEMNLGLVSLSDTEPLSPSSCSIELSFNIRMSMFDGHLPQSHVSHDSHIKP